jgi:hypothetical protein
LPSNKQGQTATYQAGPCSAIVLSFHFSSCVCRMMAEGRTAEHQLSLAEASPRKRARLGDVTAEAAVQDAARAAYPAFELTPLVSTSSEISFLPPAASLTQFNAVQLQSLKSLLAAYKVHGMCAAWCACASACASQCTCTLVAAAPQAEHQALLDELKLQFNRYWSASKVAAALATHATPPKHGAAGADTPHTDLRVDVDGVVNGRDKALHQQPSPPAGDAPTAAPAPAAAESVDNTSQGPGGAVSLDNWVGTRPGTGGLSNSSSQNVESKTPQSGYRPKLDHAGQTVVAAAAAAGAGKEALLLSPVAEEAGGGASVAAGGARNIDAAAATPCAGGVRVGGQTNNVGATPATIEPTFLGVERALLAAVLQKQRGVVGQADRSLTAVTAPDRGVTMLGGSEAQPVIVGGRLRFAQGPQPHSAEQVLRWEALASAVSEQDLDEQGALACLVVTRGRYLIRHTTVLLGRSTGVCVCVCVRAW